MSSSLLQEQLAQLQQTIGDFHVACELQLAPPSEAVLADTTKTELGRLVNVLFDSLPLLAQQDGKVLYAESQQFPKPTKNVGQLVAVVEALKQEDTSGSTIPLLDSVCETVKKMEDALGNGILSESTVSKALEAYVTEPIFRLLKEEGVARTTVTGTAALCIAKDECDATYQPLMQSAENNSERHSVNSKWFKEREPLLKSALHQLEKYIASDSETLAALGIHGAVLLKDAYNEITKKYNTCHMLYDDVEARPVQYYEEEGELDSKLETLEDMLNTNTSKLSSVLGEAINLIAEQSKITREITQCRLDQKIWGTVKSSLAETRSEALATLGKEKETLTTAQDAVKTFKDEMNTHVETVKDLCKQQQEDTQNRIQATAKLYGAYYTEYYFHLHDIIEAKQKSLKSIKEEMDHCSKERQLWQQLEADLPDAKNLVQLEERQAHIKEFQTKVEEELKTLQTRLLAMDNVPRLLALDTMQTNIFALIPDFIHPKDVIAQKRVKTLLSRKRALEECFGRYKGLDIEEDSTESMMYEDEEGAEINKHIASSPLQLVMHLRHVEDELDKIPCLQPLNFDDESCTVPPTPEQVAMARFLKGAHGTRGTAFKGAAPKRRRIR